MQMRWFTRLTNAFSKKVTNLKHVALHYMHYNYLDGKGGNKRLGTPL
jgi:hypothetical protein